MFSRDLKSIARSMVQNLLRSALTTQNITMLTAESLFHADISVQKTCVRISNIV